MIRHFLLIAVLAFTNVGSAAEFTGLRYFANEFAAGSAVLARNGVAATSQPLATQVALDILQRGGSAVDAAIAANAMLGVTEPYGCGPGGDLLALVWDPASAKLHGLNASGRAPAGLSVDQLRALIGARDRLPMYGPLTLTVPGTVDGWFELHERFGKLPMPEVLAPAIRYARQGVPIVEYVAWRWQLGDDWLRAAAEVDGKLGGYQATFLIDGKVPGYGDVFRNPGLAETYELIAAQGRDAFYRGAIARRIAGYVKSVGGYVDVADLESHRSDWVQPIAVNYRGYDVYQVPPNSQGLAVLQMLNILEGFDVGAMGYSNPDYWHVLVEAKKLAFEDRARFYADPEFVQIPVEQLLSREYATQRRKLINPNQALKNLKPGDPRLAKGDTTYLSVADRDGMMISLIQSHYWAFGSGLVPPGLGFALQNRGSQFALQATHANVYAPRKRTFNTIMPGFVMKDGQPWLSFGVMGGSAQPQGQVQVLVNLIDFGMGVQAAGDAARMYHKGSATSTGQPPTPGGGKLYLEPAIGGQVLQELQRRGHDVSYVDINNTLRSYTGGYQGILRDPDTGVYYGASEMRTDGQAAGY